jgi:hypothetical protein
MNLFVVLYWETWPVARGKNINFRAFEKKVLKRIFAPVRNETIGF